MNQLIVRIGLLSIGRSRGGGLEKMGKVISILTGKQITDADYMDLLDAVEKQIRELHKDGHATMKILAEMRFCARFSPYFREQTYGQLASLLEDLYIEANS
jgi:hypothetical protein